MWIFTETGFISAVRKPEYPGVVTVRSRDRKSLEALAAKAQVEIKRSPKGDYPYRVFVGDGPFSEWFLDRGGELEYSNFKNRVAETRGKEFANALNKVWVAMLSVEDAEARSPLNDAAGNPIASVVLGGFADLSEEEQIAWAEKAAENLRERVLESEKREINWSEEAVS
jgi:hypothetical protein